MILLKRFLIMLLNICLLFVLSSCWNNVVDNNIFADELLRQLKDGCWKYINAKSILGDSDSFFEEYEIYFDKGIAIKYSEVSEFSDNWKGYYYSRTGNIENILFTKEYMDEFLSIIGIGNNKTAIKNHLGKPTFEDNTFNVFGYKMADLYVFFIGENEIKEISIYPIYPVYNDKILEDVVEYCSDKKYSLELAIDLMNILEKEWTDYNYNYVILENSRYSVRDDNIGIAYYSRGIELCYSKARKKTILNVYNNYDGELPENINSVEDSNGYTLIEYHKDQDLVFEQEIKRINNQSKLNKSLQINGEISPDKKRILVDNSHLDGINVIYVNNDKPNYCILTSPFQYGAAKWINDRYIVYIYGKGNICVYDLSCNRYKKISSNYATIQSVHDGYIILEMESDMKTVAIKYQLDEQGEISFSNSNEDGIFITQSNDWLSGHIANATSNSLSSLSDTTTVVP